MKMWRLLSGGWGFWVRMLALLWFLIVAGLVISRLSQRTCSKRLFPHRDDLESSAQEAGLVLDMLQLRYWLCYGSLWGQLHERRNPAWESDVELCVLREQATDDRQDSLVTQLEAAGFTAELDARRGLLDVYRSDGTPGLVQLIFFAPDSVNKMYRRDGWLHRSLGADCTAEPELHCFPARLVAAPLKRRAFGHYEMPVPWVGFELQKYLYPDSWYRDYAPSC
ncbi:uncharacterized protein LOC119103854 isoform X1 [Pollicipes pollicipes]|uniref:uncharacterized protein LOC119103622 isoform X1 n=2 Tax=Pollicipes pollicipes TaxID=41117 RepID=UPI0018850744|nr:uncharacterized protein LOC119103622 isoform X1 [Pollicipes pollicipes]XP_037083421.1 uncharacterized protein LOC119103854 isoform X1 [Pollicipes pollicipes]